MMEKKREMKVNRIDNIKQQMRQVRRSADIIGLVELASIAVNFMLYPFADLLLPDFADGSLCAELRDLVLYVIIFALPFYLAARLSGMRTGDLIGRGRPGRGVYLMTIGLTLGWALAAGLLGGAIDTVLGGFGLTEAADTYVLPAGMAALAVQFVSVAVVPPIVEELCYRGFFLNTAARSMGTYSAIVLTAAAFWLAHYSIEILPLAFGFGLIGGYIRQRYGSLWPSICGHFAVNSTYVLINAGDGLGGEAVGTGISAAVVLVQIAMGTLGAVLFVREGCLRELLDGSFGRRTALSPQQTAAAVLTSIPIVLMLLFAVWMMAQGLEAV